MIAEIDYGATETRQFQLYNQGIPFDVSGYTVEVLVLLVGGPVWAASTAYALGDIVRPTIGNGHLYQVTIDGTSDVTEPAWPGGQGTPAGTVLDGSVEWTDITPTASVVTAATGIVEIDGLELLPRDTSYRVRYRVTDGGGEFGYVPDKNRYDVWRVQDVMAH